MKKLEGIASQSSVLGSIVEFNIMEKLKGIFFLSLLLVSSLVVEIFGLAGEIVKARVFFIICVSVVPFESIAFVKLKDFGIDQIRPLSTPLLVIFLI